MTPYLINKSGEAFRTLKKPKTLKTVTISLKSYTDRNPSIHTIQNEWKKVVKSESTKSKEIKTPTH